MSLPRWAAEIVDLLLPGGCVSCRGWIPASPGAAPPLVCARCRARMRHGPWPRCGRCHWPRGTGRSEGSGCRECASWPDAIEAARFAFELGSPVDDLVHGLKYEGWRELATFMGDALARVELPTEALPPPIAVVPVPTTPGRLRTRGYNQAELLAHRVAERCGWPLVRALSRPVAGGSQTSLTPEARRRNVQGAFAPADEITRIRRRSILLVDDVLTTGATASAAAITLREHGSGPVVALTFARALAGGARAAA